MGRDRRSLVLVGVLDGFQLQLVLWAVFGGAALWLLLLLAWKLRTVRSAARTAVAWSFYALIAVCLLLGVPWLGFLAILSTSSAYQRVESAETHLVVQTTFFLSASYTVYQGSGIFYTQVSGLRASPDQPFLTTDDFAIAGHGDTLVLRYASSAGAPKTNVMPIPPRD